MTQPRQCGNNNNSHNDDHEDDACNDSSGDNRGDDDSCSYDPRLCDTTTMTDDDGNGSDSGGRPAL